MLLQSTRVDYGRGNVFCQEPCSFPYDESVFNILGIRVGPDEDSLAVNTL
jgi:hypothetical protein